MKDKTYQVVFTGRLAKGKTPKDILAALCRTLNTEPQKARRLFKGPGSVIGASGERQQAERYAAALSRAGALCQVREAGSEAQPSTASEEPAKKRTATTIVDPVEGKTDFTRAPLRCARLGGDGTALQTNRPGFESFAVDRLELFSIFRASPDRDAIELLLFLHDCRRPLIVECSAIAFSDFDAITDRSLHATLRNFLVWLRRKEPDLKCDRDTAQFLEGAETPVFTGDPAAFASALGRAIQ